MFQMRIKHRKIQNKVWETYILYYSFYLKYVVLNKRSADNS